MSNNYRAGDVVVVTYGFNDVTKKPFQFLYEFGYYNTSGGCVVYIQGCKNMQDSYAFELDQIRLATEEDKKNLFYGN